MDNLIEHNYKVINITQNLIMVQYTCIHIHPMFLFILYSNLSRMMSNLSNKTRLNSALCISEFVLAFVLFF